MTFALPFNTHQNAYTTEEAVNCQLDKLNQFVDISQPLSAAIPSSKKQAYERSGKDRVVHGTNSRDFHLPRWIQPLSPLNV